MAREDPELAARLVLQSLPAAVAKLEPPLAYELTVEGLGTWHVAVDGQGARVERHANGNGDGRAAADGNGRTDFRMVTDAEGLARLAAGGSPLRLLLGGKVRVRGSRRAAMRLRAMSEGEQPTLADAVRAGAELDVDATFRSLRYLVDPDWTRGHSFVVQYEVEGAGRWYVAVDDGARLAVTTEPPQAAVDVLLRVSLDDYRRLIAGELTPTQAMREAITHVEGAVHPATLLGRWIDRAQGADDAELEREARQRELQASRLGSWGSDANGSTPASEGDLLSYPQLYALWERQNWRAHELDFSVDRDQWATSPTEAQENMLWSLGSFYIGEERVTADLAPFVMAAPSGEVEAFLSTQLVDEARHAVFFDRFGAEVMALGAEDLRGRMLEIQARMLPAWFDVFDGGLREVAKRVQANPGDVDTFVEGITTYHLIIEGVLATTGQRIILDYLERHGLYPGFQKGFGLVEQDEHRHIAFGVRYLRDAVAEDPSRGEIVVRRVRELVPKAVHVFWPPYADSPREFVTYGYHSSQIYGFAYRKLKRRMQVIGLECPPPEELMPGPLATPEEARAAGVPV